MATKYTYISLTDLETTIVLDQPNKPEGYESKKKIQKLGIKRYFKEADPKQTKVCVDGDQGEGWTEYRLLKAKHLKNYINPTTGEQASFYDFDEIPEGFRRYNPHTDHPNRGAAFKKARDPNFRERGQKDVFKYIDLNTEECKLFHIDDIIPDTFVKYNWKKHNPNSPQYFNKNK